MRIDGQGDAKAIQEAGAAAEVQAPAGAEVEAAPAHDHEQARVDQQRRFASSALGESAMRARLDQLVGGGDDALQGAGFGDTAGVASARSHAEIDGAHRFDWSHGEQALDRLSQFGRDRNLGLGRSPDHDAVRCGAAAITAGVVLNGAGRADGARDRLIARAERLQSETATTDPIASLHAEAALSELRGLPEDPRTWTFDQMHQLQEGIFELGSGIDQQMHRTGSGLDARTVRDLRDDAWGDHQPTYRFDGSDAQPVDVHLDRSGGGHFILAEGHQGTSDSGDAAVAYDPWPDADGTAFSQAVDGEDRTLDSSRSLDVDQSSGRAISGR